MEKGSVISPDQDFIGLHDRISGQLFIARYIFRTYLFVAVEHERQIKEGVE